MQPPKIRKILWIFITTLLVSSVNVSLAESTAEESADTGMTDEMREAIANVGLLAGNALQCSPKDQHEVIADQIFQGGNLLVQDHGTYQAFLLMIYFGVGSKESIDNEKCEQILADWQGTVEDYALDVQ